MRGLGYLVPTKLCCQFRGDEGAEEGQVLKGESGFGHNNWDIQFTEESRNEGISDGTCRLDRWTERKESSNRQEGGKSSNSQKGGERSNSQKGGKHLGKSFFAPKEVQVAGLVHAVEREQPDLEGGGLDGALSLPWVHLLKSALVMGVQLGGHFSVALVPDPFVVMRKLGKWLGREGHEVGGDHHGTDLLLVQFLPLRKMAEQDFYSSTLFGSSESGHVT